MMNEGLNKLVNNLSESESGAIEAITSSMMELIEPCIRQRSTQWLKFIKEQTKPEPLPPFFKDILKKLEFSAQQSELWENPEDAGIVAIEYRALAMKLERWMESHG